MEWNRITDGTANPPRLELQQSWWAMGGLGENGKEWTLEQKFEKIAEAGFKGICGFLPAQEEMDKWHRLLDHYRLSFSTLAFPRKLENMVESIRLAKQFGRVQYINTQVMEPFVIDQEAIRLLEELLQVSKEAGIPNFIETHRGTITQDLIRTANYVEALPQLQLMIDLSHYVVAGELNGTCAKTEALFERLLARSAGMHARVSNGEQVQIDIGENGEHPMVSHFARWWRKGMKSWLRQAKSGDVFPFCTELGPPKYYAITRRDGSGREIEISDRWQQALLFKRMIEQLWQQANLEE
ncbi:sugar phosphate isomerase/epimerase family protein [Neobacillus niacini]|uniref:sugar phosphate isomerase/epimerase family protein n=1 Tax=Neobacillus niacini TaxID=86668 RepID=UPI0005EE968C|nr:TIM barrel protein [Neobacillus niacini]